MGMGMGFLQLEYYVVILVQLLQLFLPTGMCCLIEASNASNAPNAAIPQ